MSYLTNVSRFCGSKPCYSLTTQRTVKSKVRATAILQNIAIPKIGATITVRNRPTAPQTAITIVLTKANYADSLEKWVREQQYNCVAGNTAVAFFPWNEVKGTQPEWTPKTEGLGDEEELFIDYQSMATSYTIENGIDNQGFFNDIMLKNPQISVIDFLDGGVYVYPYGSGIGDFVNRLTKASTPLSGDGKARTMLEIYHKGIVPSEFYRAAVESTFEGALKGATSFSFANNLSLLTDLVVDASCTSGTCKAYTKPVNTAFNFSVVPDQNVIGSCMSYALYLCDITGTAAALPAAVAAKITINPSTGVITSTTGLIAGLYKFIVSASNNCCVVGEYCLQITV
jgi:hypothetical protein